jgi:hypothetical protein
MLNKYKKDFAITLNFSMTRGSYVKLNTAPKQITETSLVNTARIGLWLGLLAASMMALPAQADIVSLTATVKKLYGNNNVVKETIFKDLYRIEAGPTEAVYYVNDAATLILETNNINITAWTQPVQKPAAISDAEKTKILNAILHNIRFDKLIQITQGKGTNKVLLLSAYDCGFCIKFEQMLAAAGDKIDASFFIIPYTLEGTDQQRKQNVQNIWCAADNAKIWREGLLKATLQYPSSNAAKSGCSLTYADARDFQVILKSLGARVGFPLMIADNGLPLTPKSDLDAFKAQLDSGTHKLFWVPEMLTKYPTSLYTQFRVENASARGWYQ